MLTRPALPTQRTHPTPFYGLSSPCGPLPLLLVPFVSQLFGVGSPPARPPLSTTTLFSVVVESGGRAGGETTPNTQVTAILYRNPIGIPFALIPHSFRIDSALVPH